MLASLQAQKGAIAEQLASAKRNFEVGTTNITDTNEAQASADLEIAATNNLGVAHNALQQIIFKAPAPLATLRTGVKRSAPEQAAIEAWVNSPEQQNFGVLGQEITLDIAKPRHQEKPLPSGCQRQRYSFLQRIADRQFDRRAMEYPDIFRRHRQQQRTPGTRHWKAQPVPIWKMRTRARLSTPSKPISASATNWLRSGPMKRQRSPANRRSTRIA